MVLLSDEALVVARFGPFGDSVILRQDWCTVCTDCTIGSEIILDAPNGTCGSGFGPLRDSTNLDAR